MTLLREALATVKRLKDDNAALKLDNLNLRVRLAQAKREAAQAKREAWDLTVKLEQAETAYRVPPIWLSRTGPGAAWIKLPHYTMDNVGRVRQ